MGADERRVLQHVPSAAGDAARRRAGGNGHATRYADDARLGSRDADDATDDVGVAGRGAACAARDAGGTMSIAPPLIF